ncbi:MAG: nucleotidyltransferase domain-containing protein [Nitrososphaerota archaeon]
MEILEGHYVKVCGDIYAVKGVLHPPRKVVAIPTYVRKENGRYHRIRNLKEAFSYIEEKKPSYLEYLNFTGQKTPLIPLNNVDEVYDPVKFDRADTEASRDALMLKEILTSSSSKIKIGITGSILLGLDEPSSDIDLVVYGVNSGERFIDILKDLRINNVVKPVNTVDWLIETRRDSNISPEDWLRLESRKLLTGVFNNRLYTSKIVPFPREHWEDLSQRVREIGRARMLCRVVDSRFGKTTPNLYLVEVLKIMYGDGKARDVSQVMSMRSRFAEIASNGDIVEVEGRLEEVCCRDKKIYRIFLGNDERDKFLPVYRY